MKKGFRLQALVYSLIISLLLPVAGGLSPTLAAESSPSADIKVKLDELKREIASKAASLKSVMNQKLKDKAYIGKVKSKIDATITLEASKGAKIVRSTQDTVFENGINKKGEFSLKILAEENYIAALGDIDDTGVLIARKIVLLPTPNSEPKTYLWGQIISISDSLATLKDRGMKNISISGIQEAKLNDFVILTGVINKNNIFKTEFVHVIPQGGILKPKKATSTNSGKVVSPKKSN